MNQNTPTQLVMFPPLAIPRLKPPPQNPSLHSFDNFTHKWSWAILPSPYDHSPFSQTPLTIITTPFISHEASPQEPDKPLWNSEAWRIARIIPNDAPVSIPWKDLNHVVLPRGTLHDYPVCECCQGFTSLNHILFKCPASQELWREFDQPHNLTIQPTQ